MRQVGLFLVGLALASPLTAQEVVGERGAERVHHVRAGDTLWDLARTYLGNPRLWPEIYRLNADLIREPGVLQPSTRLRIPAREAPEYGVSAGDEHEPARTVFFPRPDDEVGRPDRTILPAGTADVPVVTLGAFYRAAFIRDPREVRPIGRLAEREFASVVPLEMPPQITLYDRVYVALSDAGAAAVGDHLHLVRPAQRVRRYGQLFSPTGMGRVVALEGAAARVEITAVFDRILLGDLTLPVEPFPVVPGVQPMPAVGLDGRIVAFQEPHPLQQTQGIAFLDVGRLSGVAEGDEFVAYRPRERRRWGIRPEIEVARLQVVRTDERTSAARILTLLHPAVEVGMPARLVARMP